MKIPDGDSFVACSSFREEIRTKVWLCVFAQREEEEDVDTRGYYRGRRRFRGALNERGCAPITMIDFPNERGGGEECVLFLRGRNSHGGLRSHVAVASRGYNAGDVSLSAAGEGNKKVRDTRCNLSISVSSDFAEFRRFSRFEMDQIGFDHSDNIRDS